MFRTERFFSVVNPNTGLRVWYFLTREGRQGPFTSKTNAQLALCDFIVNNTKQGSSSRRTRLLASG